LGRQILAKGLRFSTVLFLLFAVVVLYTCAVQRVRTHTIESGETLWEISRAYDIPLETLISLNNIEDATDIVPGDEILLPISSRKRGEVARVAVGEREEEAVGEEEPGEEDYAELPEAAGSDFVSPEEVDFEPVWPVDGRLISRFKPGGDPTENGILIEAPPGTAVKAAASGEVKMAGLWESYPEFGKIIIIAHEGEFVTVYAHLDETKVTRGDTVEGGEQIGVVGSTGVAEGDVTYFELRYQLEPRDPLLFLGEPG